MDNKRDSWKAARWAGWTIDKWAWMMAGYLAAGSAEQSVYWRDGSKAPYLVAHLAENWADGMETMWAACLVAHSDG